MITLSSALAVLYSQLLSILTSATSFVLGVLGFFHLSKFVNSDLSRETFAVVNTGVSNGIEVEEVAALRCP